jgi:hypothetical protein
MSTWPMRASGGVFLMCVGASLVLGAAAEGPRTGQALFAPLPYGFVIGAAALILTAIARRRAGQEKPTPGQQGIAWLALALELVVLGGLAASGVLVRLPGPLAIATILSVVSLHFILMRWSHGPWMLWLGVSGLAWIWAATFMRLAVTTVVAGDGAIKIACGALMAGPLIDLLGRNAWPPSPALKGKPQ